MAFKKRFIKKSIIGGLVSGLVFALGMAGFDYLGGNDFNAYQFLFYFIGFGFFWSLILNYHLIKDPNHNKN